MAQPGKALGFTLKLSQTGTTVSGIFFVNPQTFTIAPATISASGALTFSGSVILHATSPPNVDETLTETWDLTSPISGTVTEVRAPVNGDGQSTVIDIIGTTTRMGASFRGFAVQ